MTVATARDYLQMVVRTSMSPSAGRQGRSNVVAAVIVRARSQALPATSRHSCSAVCVLVFRRPHRVCLPAVCRVDRVFRSPPVDSKVRPYVQQRRRAGAFGGASGRIPHGAVGLVPACCAGLNRGGATSLRIFYFPVALLCIFWLTRSPRAANRETFVCLGVNCFVGRYVVAGDNAASNAPDLFRPPKLRGAGPG